MGRQWAVLVDTARPEAEGERHDAGATYPLADRSLVLLRRIGELAGA